MEYYSAIKKNEIFAIRNDMDRVRVYQAKQNKSVRERQMSYDLTYIWNLGNKTDEHMGRGKKQEKGQQTIRDP